MTQQQGDKERLFDQFPAVTRDEWEKVINKDLKGADYERRLVWRPLEGFSVRPYYRAEDLEALPNRDVAPGEYPYIRGNHKDVNQWLIREDVQVESAEKGNALAHNALARGANSVGFVLHEELPFSVEFFKALFAGIDPLKVEINLVAPFFGHKLFLPLHETLEKLGGDWLKIKGAVEYAPLSSWLQRGERPAENDEGLWVYIARAVRLGTRYPGLRTLCVDATVFHGAGATAVQDLGFALLQAMEYIIQMKERDIRPEEVAQVLRFKFAVGATYFMEMAKLRAARGLWARSLEAFGIQSGECTKMQMHVETSRWNQTVYDPYVNMLRGTTESMSAVIAGVHSLYVVPFDDCYATPNEFSAHLGRNTQHLLREEAYFDKVVDPAGGSYYVETLTYSVAKHAWDLFLAFEEKGGYTPAMQEGRIQEAIATVAKERKKRVAMRKDTLVGTNQFPNFNEQIQPEVQAGAQARKAQEATCEKGEGKVCSLPSFRGAEEFEALRFATDQLGRRPVAFMLAVGNLAMRRARAQFSCNFLACAGMEVIDNIGFETLEEGLEAARKAQSDIIVLCSSDEEYAEYGAALYPLIHHEREIMVVAGAPACQEELEKVGVKHFISVRSNLLETLKGFMHTLTEQAKGK